MPATFATDRFYSDITSYSASMRYRVSAESPDNKEPDPPPFQSSFVYQFVDTESGKLIWERKQRMMEPVPPLNLSLPEEGSPTRIDVSDDAWTVIHIEWHGLVFIDPNGDERGTVIVAKEPLSSDELKQLIRSTGGPSGSVEIRHFLRHEGNHLFVIRPWSGRHLVFDIEKGSAVPASQPIVDAAIVFEKDLVLASLNAGGKVSGDCSQLLTLAGAVSLVDDFRLFEALPMVRTAEESNKFTSFAINGLSSTDHNSAEIDPHHYATRELRKLAQGTLRRLGQVPRPLPIHDFSFRDPTKGSFVSPVPDVPRMQNADRIKVGMLARETLNLIGSPDDVGYGTWSYYMDAANAVHSFCLILTWDDRRIVKIERTPLPEVVQLLR